MTKHPIQPLEELDGVIRFKRNNIVRFLLDNGPYDMNYIAQMEAPAEDHEQFAQLIGYSWHGASELDYVRSSTLAKAWKAWEKKT